MEKNTNRKLSAFGLSVIIHSVLLLFIATLTVDLTTPEGTVDGMEFSIAPKGSQVETVNVEPIAKPEIPEKVKSQPAPPPPPPPKVEAPQEVAQEAIEPIAAGTLPVEAPPENIEEPKSFAETPPVETPAEPEQVEPPQELPPVFGNSESAAAPEQSGTDAVDLAGQEKTSDQTYGRADGVKDALTLTALPGNRPPEYPYMARFRRIEGTTVVHFEVSADGVVSNVRLASSNQEMFNAPSLEAVRTWKFRPPVDAGTYERVFNFRLKGEAQTAPSRLRRK